MAALLDVVREGLVVTAILCFPVLALATAIGLAVAVVQAATQVQEQTLTLLPKMLAVGAAVVFFGPFALWACARLFDDIVVAIPAIVFGAS
jgi:flagellar biosynthetic protein FliQ